MGNEKHLGPRLHEQQLQAQQQHAQQQMQQQNESPVEGPPSQQQLLAHRIFDRQIRLWGVEAQTRLLSARLLVVGLTSINVELLKNMTLAGVHATLCDDRVICEADFSFNFLLNYSDCSSKTVAAGSRQALQAMAPLRECSCLSEAVFSAAAAQAAAAAAETDSSDAAAAAAASATSAAAAGAAASATSAAATSAAAAGAAATGAAAAAGTEMLEDVLRGFSAVCVAAEFYPLPILMAIDMTCRKLNIGFCFSHCSGKMGFSFADFHRHQFHQQQQQPSTAAAAAATHAAEVVEATEKKAAAAAAVVVEEEEEPQAPAAAKPERQGDARTAAAAADTGAGTAAAPSPAATGVAAAAAAASACSKAAQLKERVYPSLSEAFTWKLGDANRRVDRGLLAYVALLRWMGEKQNFGKKRGITAPRYVFHADDFLFAASARNLLFERSKGEKEKAREAGRPAKRGRSDTPATAASPTAAVAEAAAQAQAAAAGGGGTREDALLPCLSMMAGCQYTPTAAVIGGLLAQELRKYLTREQEPIPNCIFFNFDSSTAATAMLPPTPAAAAVTDPGCRMPPAAVDLTGGAAAVWDAAAAAGVRENFAAGAATVV